MAANAELKVRCPSCGAKYRFPAQAVGRKARCLKCRSVFRIADPRADSHRLPSPTQATSAPPRPNKAAREGDLKRPPTEDDILRWLLEADDDADRERRSEMADKDEEPPPASSSSSGSNSNEVQSPPRLRIYRAEEADDTLSLRRVV